MLGNRLSWISCKFILFYSAQDWVQEPCAIETLSLTPLAVMQRSRLIFFPLVFTWCMVKSATCEAKSEKQSKGAEGRTGWLERSYRLRCNFSCASGSQIHLGAHSMQHTCALPAGPIGTSWEREESSQLKRSHSVLNFRQIMGGKSLKNQQLYVPKSTNLNFLFWCLTCEHWCPHLSQTAKFVLHLLDFDKEVAF